MCRIFINRMLWFWWLVLLCHLVPFGRACYVLHTCRNILFRRLTETGNTITFFSAAVLNNPLILARFFCEFLGTLSVEMLRPLHFNDFGRSEARYCRIDRHGTVVFQIWYLLLFYATKKTRCRVQISCFLRLRGARSFCRKWTLFADARSHTFHGFRLCFSFYYRIRRRPARTPIGFVGGGSTLLYTRHRGGFI